MGDVGNDVVEAMLRNCELLGSASPVNRSGLGGAFRSGDSGWGTLHRKDIQTMLEPSAKVL